MGEKVFILKTREARLQDLRCGCDDLALSPEMLTMRFAHRSMGGKV